jgi:sortase B
MKKKHFFVGIIIILAAVLCYSAYSLIKEWLIYLEDEKISKEAINDFIVYEPTATETLPPASSASHVESTDLPETGSTTVPKTEPGVTEPPATGGTTAPSTSSSGEEGPNFSVNWGAMKQVNSDIVGWIWMGDSTINYPLLQGESNSEYLKTAYNGKYSALGSIFLDYRVNPDFTGENTVIYGHNGGGTKFGVLLNFKKQSYYNSHMYFYILTEQETKKYEVFSAYFTDETSSSYDVYSRDEGAYQEFLDEISAQSLVNTGIKPSASDLIVTLSTCTNNRSNKSERFVVHGRLVTDNVNG